MKKILYACLLVALVGSLFIFAKKPTRAVRYVAYVGFNYSSDSVARERKYFDQQHIAALEHYLQKLNEGERDYGVEFKLMPFECQFQEAQIPDIYRKIAADRRVALVVDNTWGKHLKEARTIIQQESLPVIALSADQNGLDFGHNALFLDPNDTRPLYLIRYIKQVLGARTLGFVTEEDYLVHQKFVQLMERDTLKFKVLARLSQRDQVDNISLHPEKAKVFQRNLWDMLSNPADSVILMNTHIGYGNELLNFLRTANGIPPKYLLGLPGTTNLSPRVLEEISKKGHTIISFETGTEAFPVRLERDTQALRRVYPRVLFTHERTSNNLRRCFDAMNIFQKALEEGKNTREGLSDYFRQLGGRKLHVNNELYKFDQDNILLRDPTFNEVHAGSTRACAKQINAEGRAIPCLQVGLDILDVNDVDIKGNSFRCNLLYWVIAAAEDIEKETYIGFENLNSYEARRETVGVERRGKFMVHIYRISGKFSCDFETFDFPFDRHEITIPVSVMGASDELKVSFDINRVQNLDRENVFEIPDWRNDGYCVTLDNQITNRLASLDKITIDTNDRNEYLEKYKSLNVRFSISRQPWGAFILIILPLLMFTGLPLFMLFFHKISFDDIGELIITSFLAAVAYSINLVQLSPTTDSMNRAYWFLLLTLVINFLCFLFVTYADNQQRRSKPRTLTVGKISVPYLLLILFVMLCYFIFR